MNPLDLLLVATSALPRKKRLASKKIAAETLRIDRENRQIEYLLARQEQERRRRINGK